MTSFLTTCTTTARRHSARANENSRLITQPQIGTFSRGEGCIILPLNRGRRATHSIMGERRSMRYWWVNQNQTYRHEVSGGYLWSPKRNANGARNTYYETMREVAPRRPHSFLLGYSLPPPHRC